MARSGSGAGAGAGVPPVCARSVACLDAALNDIGGAGAVCGASCPDRVRLLSPRDLAEEAASGGEKSKKKKGRDGDTVHG